MSKKGKILVGVAVVVIIITSTVFLCWRMTNWKVGNRPFEWEIQMSAENNTTGWTITITDIIEYRGSTMLHHNITIPPEQITYRLDGYRPDGSRGLLDPRSPDVTGEKLVWKNITEIKGEPSIPYNITWNDNDHNDLLSVGDIFFISATGGADGKVENGFGFGLTYGGRCNYLYVNWFG
ncbi:MAG: hypothetical protein QMC80_00780 [Thermoplasmatales archaeon]|nr:hypothetical protein [Thermoplasmatales archaeon]